MALRGKTGGDMVRNEESVFHGFIALKAEEEKNPKEHRPWLAFECRDLSEAEIQNEGLGEHHLRDLNDDKLIPEDPLGAPHYTRRDVQEIFKMTRHDKQVMMFSATLSKEIRPV